MITHIPWGESFSSFLLSIAIDPSFSLSPSSPRLSVPLMSPLLSASAPLSVSLHVPQLLTVPDSTTFPVPPVFSTVILLAVGKGEIWGGKFNEVIRKPAVTHFCLLLAGTREFAHPLGKRRDKASEPSSVTHAALHVLLLLGDWGGAEL